MIRTIQRGAVGALLLALPGWGALRARAARAGIAVPGSFAPVEREGRSLVDGGIAVDVGPRF